MGLFVVNDDGEVVRELDDTDLIIKRSSLHEYERMIDIKYLYMRINSPIYEDCVIKYPIIAKLSKYITLRTNMLAYSNGKPILVGKIHEALEMSEGYCKKALRELEREGIIKKSKIARQKKAIYFNYWIAMKGNQISERTYLMFQDSPYKQYVKGGRS